jgi:hypothetical protein
MSEPSNTNSSPTRVDAANDRRRKKSEISAILQDLERLQTIPTDKKKRWIWELLQNAKDEAPAEKAQIRIRLSANTLEFIHNGKPFNMDSLLALLTRTSTKPFNDGDEDGPTGKYGTGFVTSHILNRVVDIEGLFENAEGCRPFKFQINRNVSLFDELKFALELGFKEIDEIDRQPALVGSADTVFRYQINDTFQIAVDSIAEFSENIMFTLFINQERIRSITIEDQIVNSIIHFKIHSDSGSDSHAGFVHIDPAYKEDDPEQKGLLYWRSEKMILAVPAIQGKDGYRLTSIGQKARLYKEFPLIGTENAHLPYLVQSEKFLPPEARDGIRTAKSNENFPDHTADINRGELINFRNSSLLFFEWLTEQKVKGLHLLAESGLPDEKLPYTGVTWYGENIQAPLRKYFIELPLVNTISGKQISLRNAKIPQRFDDEQLNQRFYDLASLFNKTSFPDHPSFTDWQRVVTQDSDQWDASILFSPDDLAAAVNKEELANYFGSDEEKIAVWLNQLIVFFYDIKQSELCETYPIYLDRNKQLRMRTELAVDKRLNPKMISIGDDLEQAVSAQLLHPLINHIEGVAVFDIKSYYDKLNKYIGDLVPSEATALRYPPILRLTSIFNDSNARERDRWHSLCKQLLPDLVPDKLVVHDMFDYNFGSSEKASIRYVAWLIAQSANLPTFLNNYFEQDEPSALIWLNSFIEVLYRNQDYEEFLTKYAVILMQDKSFRPLSIDIYGEPKEAPYADFFKKLYTGYAGKGDIGSILIDKRIQHPRLPIEPLSSITEPVDKLFAPVDAEKLVEQNGPLNPLFHDLNTFHPEAGENLNELFSTFSLKRSSFYIKAFGPAVSTMLMKIHQLNRSIEDIEALVNLNMDAEEIAVLQKAAQMVGGTAQLVALAQQIAANAAEAAERKAIGDAAEEAFCQAIAGIQPLFIENPDYGFDFEIKHESQQKSYYLEIKSTVATKENIQMSSKQGKTAKDNPEKYALCVLNRLNYHDEITKEYFIEHARFLTTVGPLITPKVTVMESALSTIRGLNSDEETGSMLDSEQYRVFVGKKAWVVGINFDDFISFLKDQYFAI